GYATPRPKGGRRCRDLNQNATLNFKNSQMLNFALCSFPGECFSQAVLGTILNVAAILAGGLAGLIVKKQPSAATQSFFKVALGVLTVFFGLRLTLLSLGGSIGHVLKEIGIVLLSLMLGNLLVKLLHLQKASNRIGQLTR